MKSVSKSNPNYSKCETLCLHQLLWLATFVLEYYKCYHRIDNFTGTCSSKLETGDKISKPNHIDTFDSLTFVPYSLPHTICLFNFIGKVIFYMKESKEKYKLFLPNSSINLIITYSK